MKEKQTVVVLGAGYAGLMAVRTLQKKVKAQDVSIILVNQQALHYETTWLHEVAAGTISPERASFAIDEVIDATKVSVIVDTVERIDKEKKEVQLHHQTITYDYLVVALGFTTNTFGIEGVEEHTLSIQSLDSAAQIATHIEQQFETYATSDEKDPNQLAVVVGGGGFTGVEFAGELTVHLPKLAKKYGIDPSLIRITLVEGGTILGNFKNEPALVEYARNELIKRGVDVREHTGIKGFTEEGVHIGDEEDFVYGKTLVWTAGVKANPLIHEMGIALERGKARVQPDLRVEGEDHLFVIGDCAYTTDEEGNPYPPTAQLAMQHGQLCGRNLAHLLKGEATEQFAYHYKGTVASLGKTKGVGSILTGVEVRGTSGAFMKKVVDNRALWLLGGPSLLLKKGKTPFR